MTSSTLVSSGPGWRSCAWRSAPTENPYVVTTKRLRVQGMSAPAASAALKTHHQWRNACAAQQPPNIAPCSISQALNRVVAGSAREFRVVGPVAKRKVAPSGVQVPRRAAGMRPCRRRCATRMCWMSGDRGHSTFDAPYAAGRGRLFKTVQPADKGWSGAPRTETDRLPDRTALAASTFLAASACRFRAGTRPDGFVVLRRLPFGGEPARCHDGCPVDKRFTPGSASRPSVRRR